MSGNIINTTLQQTFAYDPPLYTEDGAPIKSVSDKDRIPFLGEGHYFWDNNIGMAIYWGEHRYGGKYRILEGDATLSGDKFLDLVGSREDIKIFTSIAKALRININQFTIGAFIDYARQVNERKSIFPYTIIRAMETRANDYKDIPQKENFAKYDNVHKSFLNLNPLIIVNFSNKEDIPNLDKFVVK